MTGESELPFFRHRSESLVEDFEALERRLLGDVQGWIQPDHRRVDHRHEAAAQTLLAERLGEVLRDELLGTPVLDELDSEKEALAPDVADDAVLFLHRLEASQHGGA